MKIVAYYLLSLLIIMKIWWTYLLTIPNGSWKDLYRLLSIKRNRLLSIMAKLNKMKKSTVGGERYLCYVTQSKAFAKKIARPSTPVAFTRKFSEEYVVYSISYCFQATFSGLRKHDFIVPKCLVKVISHVWGLSFEYFSNLFWMSNAVSHYSTRCRFRL